MAYLFSCDKSFAEVVAVDASLELFGRAWCIAELAEGQRMGMAQSLKLRNKAGRVWVCAWLCFCVPIIMCIEMDSHLILGWWWWGGGGEIIAVCTSSSKMTTNI